MELLFRITFLCVAGSVLALVLKRSTPEIGLCLSLMISLLICGVLMDEFGELLGFYRELLDRSGIPAALFLPVWKTAGIAMVTRIGGSICRDAGDSALAETMEIAGAVFALLAALPLMREVLELFLELIP